MPYAVDNGYFAERARRRRPGAASCRRSWIWMPARPVILFASKLQTSQALRSSDGGVYAALAAAGVSLPRIW